MLRSLALLLVILLATSLISAQAVTSGFVANELLVKHSGSKASISVASAHSRVGASVKKNYAAVPWQLVKLPAGMTVEEGIALYKKQPGIVAVEPNYRYTIAGLPTKSPKSSAIISGKLPDMQLNSQANSIMPNDPDFDKLWGMISIGMPVAWTYGKGSRDVVVAIIDTGVDYHHPDLVQNMWTNAAEIPGNGIDDDNNGYIDDIHGLNSITGTGDPMDDNKHGTHVAGTIGAVGDNNIGVVGVNWQVSMMALKFLDATGNGNTDNSITCYEYLMAMKARGVNIRAVNNSWGGSSFSQALHDIINAAGAVGIVSCCAAGNDNSNDDAVPFYPSAFDSPYLISVAASDNNDNRASFSNYGAVSVDLAAPGVGILSTTPADSYESLNGTSMATPHVTGAIALLSSMEPGYGAAELKAHLLRNVDQLVQWNGLTLTGGRLNIAKSVTNLGLIIDSLIIDDNTGTFLIGNNNGVLEPGERVALQVNLRNNNFTTASGISLTISSSSPALSIFDATSNYVDIPVNQVGNNSQQLRIGLDANFASSPEPIILTLTVKYDQGIQVFNYSLATGVATTVKLFEETVEGSLAGWSSESNGTVNWSVVSDAKAHSPTHSFFGPDPNVASTHSLLSPDIILPANQKLQLSFWHRFDFEEGYDGGVLQISVDQGGTWQDLGGKITQGGYNNLLIDAIGGAGWSGNNFTAMSQVLVNLSDFAGQTVRLKWQIKSDVSYGSNGWYVDDIVINILTAVPSGVAALQILQPLTGETLFANSSTAINWMSVGNVGDNIAINIYRGVNLLQQLSPSTPTTQVQFQWNIGDLADGDDYLVKIASTTDARYWDITNQYLKIRHIVLDSPNDKSTVRTGDTVDIRWRSGPNLFPAVNLDLYKGGQFLQHIAENIPNNGSYSWNVGRNIDSGEDYAVRIFTGTPEYSDTSNISIKVASFQPDISVKKLQDTNYTGQGIYGIDGAGQTIIDRGTGPNIYVIHIVNNGANADRMQLNVKISVRGKNNLPWMSSSAVQTASLNVVTPMAFPNGVTTVTFDLAPGAQIDFNYELENSLLDSAVMLEATVTSLNAVIPAPVDYARVILWNPTPLTGVSLAATPSPILQGNMVTLTAAPVGGGNVEYQFYQREGTIWRSLTNNKYTTSNVCTWTTVNSGAQLFRVNAREVGSNSYLPGEITINVLPLLSSVELVATPSPVAVGRPLRLTALAHGGLQIEYQFFRLVDGSWVSLNNDAYVSTNIYESVPSLAGTKRFRINAREVGTANVVTFEMDVIVNPVLSAVTLAGNPTIIAVGRPLLLTATPSNGGVIEYQFYQWTSGGWVSLTGGAYKSTNTCSVTPTVAGKTLYRVNAREAGTATYKPGEITINVKPAISAVNLVGSPSPVAVGRTLRLTATPTGGAYIEYQFYLRVGSSWLSLTNNKYQGSNKLDWTPSDTGSYLFRVNAREAGTLSYVPGEVTVIVNPVLSGVTLSASPFSVTVGHQVTFIASKTGGGNVEYQFYLRSGTNWVSLTGGKYLPSATCVWIPSSTGSQLVRVNAREVGTTNYFPGEFTLSITP